MLEKMKRLVVEEEGQGMTEYAVIVGLVVVIAVALLLGLKTPIENLFGRIADALDGVLPEGE